MDTEIRINLPRQLKESLEKRSLENNFVSVEEYVTFILKEVAAKLEPQQESAMSEEEEKIVEQRLQDLGYID